MALTTKQRAFVEAYLSNGFNATQAAITAGYSKKTAYSQGSRLLKNVEIQAALETRMKEMVMSADEALLRLSQHATATMDDFIGDDGKTIDIARVRDRGKMHLMKEFTYVKNADGSERVQVKLHDAQAALNDIIKEQHLRHGEPTERTDVDDTKARDARDKLERALARIAERSG